MGTIGDYLGDYSPGFAPDCAILCAEKVRYCLILWSYARLHKRVLSISDSEGRTFESCRAHQQKSLDFIEKIRAFFLCVHILFFEIGDCFGDYTPKNRLRGGIVQPCVKAFTDTEKRPPRWRPRPLEAVADLNHLDGGERSGYAYADPEDRLKHPARLPCAGCESSCAVRPPLRPSPPAAWSAPPKSHQWLGLPRLRCVPRREPAGYVRRRSS